MYYNIGWNIEQLWKGCILAGIAHAIMVSHYPCIENEHSWDGINYSVQDSEGQRGTITFYKSHCVAAFRNDYSERAKNELSIEHFFSGASEEIINIARTETLQYLLDEVNGEIKPHITTAFWGKDKLYSNDNFDVMLNNGGSLLKYQVLKSDISMKAWQEYYEMSEEQVQLLKTIYRRKLDNPANPIMLLAQEVKMIGEDYEDGLKESKNAFEEMNIYLV